MDWMKNIEKEKERLSRDAERLAREKSRIPGPQQAAYEKKYNELKNKREERERGR